MTRFKKEMRKRGFKLECDYPYLPYENCGGVIEGVVTFVNNGYIYQKVYYTSIVLVNVIDKDFNIVNQDWY